MVGLIFSKAASKWRLAVLLKVTPPHKLPLDFFGTATFTKPYSATSVLNYVKQL